jgi:hypothetical protein
MMESQFYADRPTALSLAWGQPVRMAQRSGELAVLKGRVWLTRHGDIEDYLLEAGDSLSVRSHDVVVVEPWQRDEPTSVAWRPAQAAPLPVRGDPRAASWLAIPSLRPAR